jgi:AraC family transcriptional regulator, positive regulator of tynA and feaB
MNVASPRSVINWSTADVSESQRFDYYANALASAMFPIQVGSRPGQPFDVTMCAADLGSMTVIRQRGTPHRCFADKTNIAAASQRTFHLLVSGTSTWTMDHQGRHRLGPGDILLSDSSIPFDLNLDANFDFVNVSLSEGWVRQWLPAPALLVGHEIDGQSGWGRALSTFLLNLTPSRFESYPLPMSSVTDSIGALLALIAQDLCTPPTSPAKRDVSLFDRVRDCIHQQSSHRQLSAGEVAAAVGISPRSLHRCLARSGTTFGDTLIDIRCTHALRMLESPIFRRLTIAEIGRRAGFVDASHFARTLHARLGRTPSQIRRQCTASGGPRDSSQDD